MATSKLSFILSLSLLSMAHAHAAPRSIPVEASEMTFLQESLQIAPGEIVEFVVTNTGMLDHEFVIGSRSEQAQHRKEMVSGHGHGHAGAHSHESSLPSITLKPGETKSLLWTAPVNLSAAIEVACNLPGHYEAGMKSQVEMKD